MISIQTNVPTYARVQCGNVYLGKVAAASGFRCAYDNARPLVVDPIVLGYSTYLGGGGTDTGRAIAVDAAGNAYITGFSDSDLFPTTAGAFQTTKGALEDAVMPKLQIKGVNCNEQHQCPFQTGHKPTDGFACQGPVIVW